MPTVDLSISPPTFIQFDWNGWPVPEKEALIVSVHGISGVTQVNRAGADSSIHVHYDPSSIGRDALILEVNKAADRVLPGHDFVGR